MEQNEIKTEFRKRQIKQIIIAIIIVPVFGVLLYAKENPKSILLGLNYDEIELISVVIIGLVLIFSFINWRCPNCQKYIGKKINPNHCSNCGVELNNK